MAVAYAFKSLGGRARETSTAWGLAHAADTSVRISDSSGLKVQRERTLSTMRGAGSRVRAPGAAAASAASHYAKGGDRHPPRLSPGYLTWALGVLLTLGALVGCETRMALLTLPASCSTPHIVQAQVDGMIRTTIFYECPAE